MSITRYILFLLLLSGASCAAYAQEDVDIYDQAIEAYEFGHFEQTDSLLQNVAGSLKGERQINAFRLLALSNLNMDKPERAEE